MQPHAYVWATVWHTCPGDKLKPSVSGRHGFPLASSGVTACRADVWRCIAQIAAWPVVTFRAAGSVADIIRGGRHQRGWLTTWTTGGEEDGQRGGGVRNDMVYAAVLRLSSKKGSSLLFAIGSLSSFSSSPPSFLVVWAQTRAPLITS